MIYEKEFMREMSELSSDLAETSFLAEDELVRRVWDVLRLIVRDLLKKAVFGSQFKPIFTIELLFII